MSLVHERDGDPVHYPKHRDFFQFDDEVAAIFPNMAARSIPMYGEVHRFHAALVSRMYGATGTLGLLDIGASRGQFIGEICNQFQIDRENGRAGVDCWAIESSRPMLDFLQKDFPFIQAIEADITTTPSLGRKFEVVSMLYVLQFIPNDHKRTVLRWLHDEVVKPGGLLILGQKEEVSSPAMLRPLTDEYMQFRVNNGYSWDEIRAKTEALKNSMWCLRRDDLVSLLHSVGFYGIEETTRWAMFSTLVCRR